MTANNYRILKLRSGSDVITKIIGSDRKNLKIHKPMEMKVASFISPDGVDRKNVLCMKDWLEIKRKHFLLIHHMTNIYSIKNIEKVI